MKKATPDIAAPASREEQLFQLELRVARRADELSRKAASNRSRDVQLWFEAEREVLGADGSSPLSTVGAAA